MLAAIAWCLGKAVSAQLEFVPAFLLILPVNLISTAPISIAGWGVRESAMVLAFSYAGLAESDAFMVSILLGLVMLAIGVLGGIIWLINPEKLTPESKTRAAATALRPQIAPYMRSNAPTSGRSTCGTGSSTGGTRSFDTRRNSMSTNPRNNEATLRRRSARDFPISRSWHVVAT